MIDRLRARQEWQFFAALPKADARLTVAWWAVLLLNGIMPAGFAVAIGVVVGAAQEGRSLTGPLTLIGIVFVLMLVVNPLQTAVSMNLGNKLSAWLNEALIHSCVDPPGIGHLEDRRPHRRPDHRPRVRPRHDRAADVSQPRLHRHRPGRSRGRAGLGRRAGRVHLVGAAGAGGGLGLDPLAAPGERSLEGPQHSRGPVGAAACRLCLPAGGRSPAGQGAADVRAGRLGGRSLHRPPQGAVRAAVPRHPAAGAFRRGGPGGRGGGQPRGVRHARRGGLGGRAGPGPTRGLRPGGARGEPDRLRRPQLGARRRSRAGGRGRPAAAGDGPPRRAQHRRASRRAGPRNARSPSATSRFATRAPTVRSSPAST